MSFRNPCSHLQHPSTIFHFSDAFWAKEHNLAQMRTFAAWSQSRALHGLKTRGLHLVGIFLATILVPLCANDTTNYFNKWLIYIYEINILYESAAYLIFFFRCSNTADMLYLSFGSTTLSVSQFPARFFARAAQVAQSRLKKVALQVIARQAGFPAVCGDLRWPRVGLTGVSAHVIPLYIYGFIWNIQWWCFTVFYDVLWCSIMFYYVLYTYISYL